MKHVHSVRWITLFLAITATAFSGCSSAPSSSDAQIILENQITKQSKGVIKLIGFTQTNAQKGDVMGTKIYSLEYLAEVEFTADCYWGGPFGGFEVMTGEPDPFNFFMYQGKKRAKQGQRKTISRELVFEKTEKGWRGQDGKIY